MPQVRITDLPAPNQTVRFAPTLGQGFLVTVDTEEEFDWNQPLSRTGHTLQTLDRLRRFQALCEAAGVAPVYLVDYPVATAPEAIAVLRPAIAAGKAEIGIQLHPWVNPPHDEAVNERNSFAGNLPPPLERAKFEQLLTVIEQNFGTRPLIYRAGRYGVGPATAELLVQCFHRAGISAAVVQLLIGGPAEGQALVAHDGIDGVLFTGSAHTGIAINRKLATRPDKIVALEMGGNNPIVVWDTPKITDAAAIVVQSAFTSAGQRCTAARRLIVKSSMYEPLLAEVKRLSDRIIVGAPFDDPAPFMGPVIDNHAADGLTESFLYLLSHGGKAIKHLIRLREDLPFLSPAIIDVTGVKDKPDVELFGPLLQVTRAEDLDEAIAEANNTRFGLSASLIGGSPQEYNRFWANVRAGVINWNRPTNGASSAAPFGGVGLSGNHRPSAYYAADYCAYPVASTEMDQPRAMIGVGLRES